MSDLSGKFIVRVSPSLHGLLKRASQKQGVSLNQFCSDSLCRAVKGVSPQEDLASFGLPIGRLLRAIGEGGYPLIGVLLFGSVSRGEATESSDIDVLLVLPPSVAPTREQYAVWDQKVESFLKEISLGRFSPQFVSLPESVEEAGGIWFEVALEGILLWEESTRVASFLAQLRKSMAQGEVIREISHGHPFWVRKNKKS